MDVGATINGAFGETEKQLSKPLNNFELDFDFSAGKLNGLRETTVNNADVDQVASSMMRDVGASRNFVRGSSSNAPFAPGGLSSSSSYSTTSRGETKRLQKDVSAFKNADNSLLFEINKNTIYLPESGLAVQYDDENRPKLLRMDIEPETLPPSVVDSIAGDTSLQNIIFQMLLGKTSTSSSQHSVQIGPEDSFKYQQAKRELIDDRHRRESHLDEMREIVQETSRSLSQITSNQSLKSSSNTSNGLSSSSTSIGSSIGVSKSEQNSTGSVVTSYDLRRLEGANSTVGWLKAAQKHGVEGKQYEWAVLERIENIKEDFETLVPSPAIQYNFEMDVFQKEAAYHLENQESVFIGAHTSAGKTVVAEYAIALASQHGTRAIYTSPIKALSNQKFHDFSEDFEDVGIITGDRSVNPDASCLIVTTEILRSMLYKGADLVRDVEWVIFDEVHYINDLERGVVWEEVIIMLPDHVGLIFLSATVPNVAEFAEWVGRVKRKKIFVITTDHRPVPLQHYLYYEKQVYPVHNAKDGFLTSGHTAVRAEIAKKIAKRNEKREASGRAKPNPMTRQQFTSTSTRHGVWNGIVKFLGERDLFPAVGFVFSQKGCMSLAEVALAHVDLTTSAEKEAIRSFVNSSLESKLKGSDRNLPQVRSISSLLQRGIGVHHGGLLPIVKEIVEMLFATGIVKILFATETFAMGVNMPTRTVVFDSIQKYDGGKGTRDLLPGEYIQMSGRAGRRSKDTVGTVIIAVFDQPPEVSALRHMITGRATRLESQFRLTYSMILNLLKLGDFRIEDMIKRSFFEASSQKETEMLKQQLKSRKEQLQDIEDIICVLPEFSDSKEAPIVAYQSLIAQERALMRRIHKWLCQSNYIGKFLPAGRILVVNVNGLQRNSLAVVVRPPAVSMATLDQYYDPSASGRGNQITILALTGSAGTSVADKYKVLKIDATSTDIVSVTQKKLKSVEAERIDVVADTFYISGIVKEMDDIRIESMGMPGQVPATIDPVKHLDIRDIAFVDMNEELAMVRATFETSPCHSCEMKEKHLSEETRTASMRAQVQALEFLCSDTNLLMIPEYEARIRVLKRLGFINQESGVVELKGRVARELSNSEELISTELIFENFFQEMSPAEICALMSCFVLEGRSKKDAPSIPKPLWEPIRQLKLLAQKLGALQVDLGVPITPDEYVEENIQAGLVEVVYEWAQAKPFNEIVLLTDIPEGSIVRTIVRLDETLRDFMNAAKLIGNVDLALKMEKASMLIKRDIVFATSLYVTDDSKKQAAKKKNNGSAVVEEEDLEQDVVQEEEAEQVEADEQEQEDDDDGVMMMD